MTGCRSAPTAAAPCVFEGSGHVKSLEGDRLPDVLTCRQVHANLNAVVTASAQLGRHTHRFIAPSSLRPACAYGADAPPRSPGYARGPGRARVRDGVTSSKESSMKKITVRKAGTVRLTSAAASCYCGGGPILV